MPLVEGARVGAAVIEVKSLSKRFGKKLVLEDLSLSVAAGAVTGLVGSNASGKTTLIKCILGLVIPDSGVIEIDGQSTAGRVDLRMSVGYMPQSPDFPASLGLLDLTKMLESLRRQKAVGQQELVESFGLTEILAQPFGELSGGTKQKIAAVLAFMFDPKIIILDEPTAGLDPRSSVEFKSLVKRRADEGKTVLIVSHFMAEIGELAQDVVYMSEGRVVLSRRVKEIRERSPALTLEQALVEAEYESDAHTL